MRTISRPLPLALVALTIALGTLTACPGELADRASYEELPACPGNIDVEALFATKCGSSICHGAQPPGPDGGASGDSAGHLDLISAGVAGRLVGVPGHGCESLLRIDPENPDNSFLLGKITEPPAGCGDRMPLVGILSQNEIACIRAWIHELAATTQVVDAGHDAGTNMSMDAATDASADAGQDASLDASAANDSGPDADVDGGP